MHSLTPPARGAGAPTPASALADRYRAVRAASVALAAPLSAEDQQVQSMPDVSPTKWHLAHTTWFFETFLLTPRLEGYQPFDPAFHYLFNSYYEAEGPRHPRPDRGLLTRPSAAEILRYRHHVDGGMATLLAEDEASVAALVELGLNHEQQHQELILMDIKHVLSCSPLKPAYGAVSAASLRSRPADWFAFPEGLRWIGHDGSAFAFDNEGPRHRIFVEAFEIADRLLTAGEYIGFIADGGYARPELWLADGWGAVQANGWQAPLYWNVGDGEARVFTLTGERPVVADEPVCHLSLYEADAYARWAGARLPTEAEWEVAAAAGLGAPALRADGPMLHPRAAGTAAGLRQMTGELWQWTSSAYSPYPRFRAAEGAIGEYNGKFMSGQMVLRGSAFATPAEHGRITYRNFFPPHSRWAFSGLRLARDA